MKTAGLPASRGWKGTIRRRIIALLEEKRLSAREISMCIGIPEKEVYHHLEHIRRTFRRADHRLDIIPSVCKGCGFVFQRRSRLTRPGKCPVCRGSAMVEPKYSLF